MAQTWSLIEEYKVVLLAGEDGDGAVAVVQLQSDKRIVGSCRFFADEGALLANSKGSAVNLSFPISAYAEVVDLLRNEGPVFLYFDNSTGKGMLTTLAEPVGEGEGAGKQSNVG